MDVLIKRLDESMPLPSYAKAGDAGADCAAVAAERGAAACAERAAPAR